MHGEEGSRRHISDDEVATGERAAGARGAQGARGGESTE